MRHRYLILVLLYVSQLVELTDMAAYLDTLTESWGRLPSTELAATMAAAARRDTAKKVRLRMRNLLDYNRLP